MTQQTCVQICMRCKWFANWSYDHDYRTCRRKAIRVTDPVTGDAYHTGELSCTEERKPHVITFWRDRCGPGGKYFLARS